MGKMAHEGKFIIIPKYFQKDQVFVPQLHAKNEVSINPGFLVFLDDTERGKWHDRRYLLR